ncbi:hypothetical protein Mapa_014220 [Marchantia paleacea]|nr:hypothetical protein Mapa_014220 [Marchantia paleacea]
MSSGKLATGAESNNLEAAAFTGSLEAPEETTLGDNSKLVTIAAKPCKALLSERTAHTRNLQELAKGRNLKHKSSIRSTKSLAGLRCYQVDASAGISKTRKIEREGNEEVDSRERT